MVTVLSGHTWTRYIERLDLFVIGLESSLLSVFAKQLSHLNFVTWDILIVCKASVKKQRVTSKCCRSGLCSLKCSVSESTVTKHIYQALQEYSGGLKIHSNLNSSSIKPMFIFQDQEITYISLLKLKLVILELEHFLLMVC